MKIGFDLHGVLDKYPIQLKPILKTLSKMDIEICVVSGPPEEKVWDSLDKAGYGFFNFSDVYSVVDFLYNKGVQFDESDPENLWCDDETWWDSKARICKEKNIDFLIDDSMKYEPAFKLVDAEFIHISEIAVTKKIIKE